MNEQELREENERLRKALEYIHDKLLEKNPGCKLLKYACDRQLRRDLITVITAALES